MNAAVLLIPAFAFLSRGTPASGQTPGALRSCDPSRGEPPGLSLLAIRTARLAPGESTCLVVTLQRGEFTRISIDADVGFLRARVLGPRRDALQVTWIWSFFPSLPLVIEAPESGAYLVELSVPS